MTNIDIFNTAAQFNKWLNELTEPEKDLVLQMMQDARGEGFNESESLKSAPTEPQTGKRSAEEMLDEAIGDNCSGFHKLEEYSWILPVMHEYAQQFGPNLSLPGDEDVKRWFQLLVGFSDGKERMEKDMRETWLQKQLGETPKEWCSECGYPAGEHKHGCKEYYNER